ncbi:sulfite exporter TauE/SafE family protein [Coralliovum pocilloporae]|uniref:sulfite exporter TauE/SafE family protein n=1 Tax=Coralliovum pocilloporae TaxID=3066369 RepID=UPI003307BA94
MSLTVLVFLALGAFAGSCVNGLAGFGTAIVALSIWLHVFDPATATALAVTCAVIGHGLAVIRRGFDFLTVDAVPLIIGGLLGIPLGVYLLLYLDPFYVKVGAGLLLMAYVGINLARPSQVVAVPHRRLADGSVGFLSGILGGFAGLSGVIPSFWGNFCGWGKLEQRRIYQTFNGTILTATLIAHVWNGVFTTENLWLALLCVPFAVVGTSVGLRLFDKVDEAQFRLFMHLLLFFSGLMLVLPAVVL